MAGPKGARGAELSALADRLASTLSRWPDRPAFVDDEEFNGWALAIHEAQVEAYPTLAAFWRARGTERPIHWSEVPPVPAAAFKAMALGPGAEAEAVFHTSGTSSGPGRRGEHRVLSLDLYRAAARGPYRRALLEEGPPVRALSLIPSPASAPRSSLARMVGFIAAEPEIGSIVWAFDESGVDVDACRRSVEGDGPVLILATAFALARLIEALAGERWSLPAASAVMETGGFKGKILDLDRRRLYHLIERHLGIAAERVVGEYGMTELLSQSYDGVVGAAPPVDERRHRFPPWVKTRVLDPLTLDPLPPGAPGVLAHYDLACLGSVCHVLTEDVGVADGDGGFVLQGRATGAEARGCSLMAEAFLQAVRPEGA